MNAPTQPVHLTTHPRTFPLNRWWIAGFSWELKDQPVARTLLGKPMVLFRTPDGQVAALQDRCCHKDLPLSCGKVEGRGLRCGYHGLLYSHEGTCVEIPGQDKIPAKAKVVSYPLREKDQILWVWVGDRAGRDGREGEVLGVRGESAGGRPPAARAPFPSATRNLCPLPLNHPHPPCRRRRCHCRPALRQPHRLLHPRQAPRHARQAG